MFLRRILIRSSKKLEKPEKISRAENIFAVHVVLGIYHILLFILILRLSMMEKFQMGR